jgi:hypothetical protein
MTTTKVGIEESIVNALLVSLQSKNTNNNKSEVSFKLLIRYCNPWYVHNRLFNVYFEMKFKKNTRYVQTQVNKYYILQYLYKLRFVL